MKRLSHIGSDGRVRMVDVSAKPQSLRIAIATGKIKIKRATANAISRNRIGRECFCNSDREIGTNVPRN